MIRSEEGGGSQVIADRVLLAVVLVLLVAILALD